MEKQIKNITTHTVLELFEELNNLPIPPKVNSPERELVYTITQSLIDCNEDNTYKAVHTAYLDYIRNKNKELCLS